MTRTDMIRRRPDGSIDTDFYRDRAHLARSEEAHKLARQAVDGLPEVPAPASLVSRIFLRTA